MAKNRRITTLIIREQIGDLTTTEQQELIQWLEQDELNANFYQEVIEHLKAGNFVGQWNSIDLKQNWEAILSKKQPKSFPLQPFLHYAAAAAVLFFVGVWIIGLLGKATITNEGSSPIVYELPDGSSVWLKPGASISFKEKDFSKNRSIIMDGEAYFEVSKHSAPFRVALQNTYVEVLGTSFNLKEYATKTELLLIEGLVRFEGGSQKTRLDPGEKATYDGSTITKVDQFDLNLIGWKTGVFHFSETPLIDVLDLIKDYYGITYELSSQKEELLVTMEMNRLTLKELIEELSFILQIEIEQKAQTLKIH